MRLALVALVVLVLTGNAQPLTPDMDVFARRRAAFMERMDSNAVAIFPSRPEMQRNLDVEYEYRQESNLYYLTGFEEPECVLVLNPSGGRQKYILFVRKRNPQAETYAGDRAGIEGAMRRFRADTAYAVDDFGSRIWSVVRSDRPLYYTFGINPELDTKIARMFVGGRSGSNWPITDPAPLVAAMRLIKDDGDWALGLRRAIDISARAHLEAMRSILPGKYEFEVQAVFEYVYRVMGSPRNGYPCIIGSGPNATILHYSTNTRQMKDGDLVLMDCAAEYGMYSADITRTVPVNGRFSKHQLDIYRIVLDAENAVIDYVMPGVTMAALDSVGNRVLADGLRRLGFVKDVKDHRVFTLHPFCHWIGLEVHDVGGYTRNGASVVLTPGMVFTVEPGIYVRAQAMDMLAQRGYTEEEIATVRSAVEPYLSIGVRIEDDVLVTAQGHQILSATAPRTPAEIESAMKERGVGKEQLR